MVNALKAADELASIRGLKQDLAAQAFCLARLGQFEQATAVYDRMIGSNQVDAEIWRSRAWLLNRIGRYEEALDSSGKSLELDPDTSSTWCYRASILLNLELPDKALDSCERAIKLNSADALAWKMRGAALVHLDLYDEAMEAFSKAVQLEPRKAEVRILMCAALIDLSRYEEALEQAQKAIEISPQEPSGCVLNGTALGGMKRYEDALQSCSKAICLGEDTPFIHFKVVELLFALDRWREGAAHLDEALGRFAHSENPNAGDCRALIRSLLPNLYAPKILQLSIKALLLLYQKHCMLGALGQGLIQFIPDIVASATLSNADAHQWSESWRIAAESIPEFRLPVRLLESAVRYRKTHDLEILMDMPQEERRLLEPLVGVHVEAIA
jgi:tetratricopeptide (TPR) repeat protein